MSHHPTLEERIALIESIILPSYEEEDHDDLYSCDVEGCVHCPCTSDTEAVGDQGGGREPLDGEIDQTISVALQSLRDIFEDGDTEEVLAATEQVLAFLVTDATE